MQDSSSPEAPQEHQIEYQFILTICGDNLTLGLTTGNILTPNDVIFTTQQALSSRLLVPSDLLLVLIFARSPHNFHHLTDI